MNSCHVNGEPELQVALEQRRTDLLAGLARLFIDVMRCTSAWGLAAEEAHRALCELREGLDARGLGPGGERERRATR